MIVPLTPEPKLERERWTILNSYDVGKDNIQGGESKLMQWLKYTQSEKGMEKTKTVPMETSLGSIKQEAKWTFIGSN